MLLLLLSLSLVAKSCPTLCDPMDCNLPGSSVPGIFQARVLDQGAISFSRDLPKPGMEPKSPDANLGRHGGLWENLAKASKPVRGL